MVFNLINIKDQISNLSDEYFNEEKYIAYVALTRSKKDLYLVEGGIRDIWDAWCNFEFEKLGRPEITPEGKNFNLIIIIHQFNSNKK